VLLSATNRDLFVIALRVWTCFNTDLDLAPEDVLTLKRHARPDESRLRIDELACEFINRELL
jgi:hypothetical protein